MTFTIAIIVQLALAFAIAWFVVPKATTVISPRIALWKPMGVEETKPTISILRMEYVEFKTVEWTQTVQ